VAASVVLAAGCQTGKDAAPAKEVQEPPREFRPGRALAQLQFDEGSYPTLFAPSSHAVWVDGRVLAIRREAAAEAGTPVPSDMLVEATQLASHYALIECHIASVFADMSIAYDVVGLRNVSVYLSLPDGRKVQPLQTVLDTSAEEEQRGALKLFARTNVVIFPKRDLWMQTPLMTGDMPGVRLVLEAHGSRFFFEWPGTGLDALMPVSDIEQERVLKQSFHSFYDRVRALSHTLD